MMIKYPECCDVMVRIGYRLSKNNTMLYHVVVIHFLYRCLMQLGEYFSLSISRIPVSHVLPEPADIYLLLRAAWSGLVWSTHFRKSHLAFVRPSRRSSSRKFRTRFPPSCLVFSRLYARSLRDPTTGGHVPQIKAG